MLAVLVVAQTPLGAAAVVAEVLEPLGKMEPQG
jgi:hypothetical protein